MRFLGADSKRGLNELPSSQRAATRYQFMIDLLDVWIPASGLGIVNFNDGVVGALGCDFDVLFPSVIANGSHLQVDHVNHVASDAMEGPGRRKVRVCVIV